MYETNYEYVSKALRDWQHDLGWTYAHTASEIGKAKHQNFSVRTWRSWVYEPWRMDLEDAKLVVTLLGHTLDELVTYEPKAN